LEFTGLRFEELRQVQHWHVGFRSEHMHQLASLSERAVLMAAFLGPIVALMLACLSFYR
jgi:hypothetical protein